MPPACPLERTASRSIPQLKDAWGLPSMRVTFKNASGRSENQKFLLARQHEILEAAGAKKIWDFGLWRRATVPCT